MPYFPPPSSGTVKSTSGFSTGPASTLTQVITHNLGTTPQIVRVNAMGEFLNSASGRVYSTCSGTYNATGNRCNYKTGGGVASSVIGSSVFSLYMDNYDTGGTPSIIGTGVIQNVGATTFNVAWTANGSCTPGGFLWEAQ